ncbi:unnamed protein product [Rhizophagus irregularis]|nr:unnamed protein product [Rhizophagus irregularis]
MYNFNGKQFKVGTSYEATISIEVEKEDTIDVLREKIKVNEDYEFDEQNEFTIWKINLLKRKYRKKAGLVRGYISFNLGIKEVLGGERK